MARCAGRKGDGSPCEHIVTSSQTYCYAHDPARSGERKRNASKAGKGSGSREIRDLKAELRELAEGVKSGRSHRADAAVVNQILNTRARLLEIERRLREADELEERIAALEAGKGGASWGA